MLVYSSYHNNVLFQCLLGEPQWSVYILWSQQYNLIVTFGHRNVNVLHVCELWRLVDLESCLDQIINKDIL